MNVLSFLNSILYVAVCCFSFFSHLFCVIFSLLPLRVCVCVCLFFYFFWGIFEIYFLLRGGLTKAVTHRTHLHPKGLFRGHLVEHGVRWTYNTNS